MRRGISRVHIPVWEPDVCIQCGQCSFVCPHATIRMNAYEPGLLKGAPPTFKSADATGPELKGLRFTVQVAPEDCTGCGSCVFVCPAFKKGAGRKEDRGLQGHQYASPGAYPCAGSRKLPVLPRPTAHRPGALQHRNGQGQPVGSPSLRIPQRLSRLRRNALHKAPHAALRRPAADRQCHGMHLHLRRQSPDYPLHEEGGRQGAGVVELSLRGQRRVRPGDETDRREVP